MDKKNLKGAAQLKNTSLGLKAALCMALFFAALGSSSLAAQSGRDIMKKVQKQGRIHKSTESDVYMLILDKNKKKRERYFSSKKKVKGNITNSIVKFYKPASVKGTGLLTVSNEKSASNKQWIYLPALRSLKQLSSDDKNKSFMGSDFTNDDIAGRELDRDKHKLLATKGDYYHILSIPKKKSDPYSKLEIKVHRKIYVITEVVFYDSKGRKLKILENKKIKQFKGMYVVVLAEMRNLRSKGMTTLKVGSVKVGHKISDNDVGIKGLR